MKKIRILGKAAGVDAHLLSQVRLLAVLLFPLESVVICLCILQFLEKDFIFLYDFRQLLNADALVQRALEGGLHSGLQPLWVKLGGVQVDVEHFLEQQAVSTLNFISLF